MAMESFQIIFIDHWTRGGGLDVSLLLSNTKNYDNPDHDLRFNKKSPKILHNLCSTLVMIDLSLGKGNQGSKNRFLSIIRYLFVRLPLCAENCSYNFPYPSRSPHT